MGHAEDGVTRLIRQVPFVGDWLHLALAGVRLRRASGTMAAVQAIELKRRGYLPAILSSIRGILQDRQEDLHRAIGRADVPVVALWGDKDDIVPLSGLGSLSCCPLLG